MGTEALGQLASWAARASVRRGSGILGGELELGVEPVDAAEHELHRS
jgi:hypothetical protein